MAEDSIVVEESYDPEAEDEPVDSGGALVSWIMDKVDTWRTHRDTQHAERWDEYYKIWRGLWAGDDSKKKGANRSKIVAPATMQAVDSTVAEIEEAVFGREAWVDIEEDYQEGMDREQRSQMITMRDALLERMNRDGVPTACAKAFLNAAIYGTGIGKINTAKRVLKDMVNGQEKITEEPYVELISLEPYEFVPDPTTDNIDEMLGMAHETLVPYHKIRSGIRSKRYRDVDVEKWDGEVPGDSKAEIVSKVTAGGDGVLVCEYHGLVPARYLMAALIADGEAEYDEALHEMLEEGAPEDYLIEAIVTIANKGILLSAKKNPFLFEDRCFISYQHDMVPNYFWGRGVPEKGYNPQKALDAEIRSRLDALGLISHPMVAGDLTRMPRGTNLGVWPGKFWGTTGDPREVIQPFTFGNLNQATFTQAGEMERMVQMATGSFDPAGPSMQTSATNTAMNSSAFLKRAKRTMQAIERQWMKPMIRKFMLRYMQFEPDVFPYDPKFCVKGTLGMMARELEQQQLIQMLSIVPQGSPMSMMLMKAIFDNSSSPHKKDMVAAVDQFLAPPSEEAQAEQQKQKQIQEAMTMATLQKLQAEAAKAQAEAARAQAQAEKAYKEADMIDEDMANEQIKNAIDLREVEAFEMQNQISQMMTLLRSFDLAIKAKQAEANIAKTRADANKIRQN